MESRSKFACLYIDDDSDEDFNVAGGKQTSKKSDSIGTTKQAKGGGKLIVHSVEKRPKAKKAVKEKVIDAATGLIVQEDHSVSEPKYCENLKQSVREGAQLARNSSGSTQLESNMSSDLENKNMGDHNLPTIGKIMRPVDEDARVHDYPSFANCEEVKTEHPKLNVGSEVIEWYKKKLGEAIEQMLAAKENAESAQAELERYKARYRKLVELFRDAEVTEKAKLIIELDKARTSEAELGSQLVVTQTELEQYKSRLRTLGALK